MKTTVLIAAIAVFTLASCNKNKQYCWTCDIDMPDGANDTTRTICNATKESIKTLEAGGAYKCEKQ